MSQAGGMLPIKLQDDERTAAVPHSVDGFDFHIVRLSIDSIHSKPSAAFVVHPSMRLEQVAVVAISGDAATMSSFSEWTILL